MISGDVEVIKIITRRHHLENYLRTLYSFSVAEFVSSSTFCIQDQRFIVIYDYS
jgi:hypothetical protein